MVPTHVLVNIVILPVLTKIKLDRKGPDFTPELLLHTDKHMAGETVRASPNGLEDKPTN